MNWIIRTFVAKWLKGLLDKIPGDGKKTILGFLLLILGELLKILPEYAPFIAPVIELLNSLGPDVVDVITDMGVITLAVGLVHKIAKLFAKKTPA